MKTQTVTGILSNIIRHRSSVYGNPRYGLVLDGQREYRTLTDASVAYEVTNYKIGRRVTLTLDGRGAVVGMQYA